VRLLIIPHPTQTMLDQNIKKEKLKSLVLSLEVFQSSMKL